jgi:cyclin C
MDYNIRIHHPSEYLQLFTNSDEGNLVRKYSEIIISDSFLTPCCIIYKPAIIAEGAFVMASAMQDIDCIPKSINVINFINDMKQFYKTKDNL